MQQILADALTLAPVERTELIELLHESFNRTNREHLDQLWAVEAEERLDAYERGDIGTSSSAPLFSLFHRSTGHGFDPLAISGGS